MANLGRKDGNNFSLIGALLKRNPFAHLGEYIDLLMTSLVISLKNVKLLLEKTRTLPLKMKAFGSI